MPISYSLVDECELVTLLNQEDENAFNEIYRRYWRKLYDHSYKRLRNKDLSADVVQDVFADLWINRSTKKIKNLGSYLYTSTRYQVFGMYKRHKNIFHLEEIIDSMIVSSIEADTLCFEKEVNECLTRWLSVQPERRKEVFRLKFVEGKNSREISEMLNVSQKTVQNQFTTSLNLLRNHLSRLLTILF